MDASIEIDEVWLEAIRNQTPRAVGHLLPVVKSISEVVVLFDLLGWSNEIYECVTTEDWSRIVPAFDRVIEDEQQWAIVLMVLVHAIRNPSKGVEPLFEFSVPIIYHGLLSGDAPDFLKSYIYENSPKYWLIPNWDLCARLKRQIERIYYYEDLRSTNLEKLFSNSPPRNRSNPEKLNSAPDPRETLETIIHQGDSRALEEAVSNSRNALLDHDKETTPLDWAEAQMNVGRLHSALGLREREPLSLEAAVEAYRDALTVYTRDRAPLDWAEAQVNLGDALSALGEQRNETPKLEAAVEAYRAALKENTRDRVPLDWAETQVNLGKVLTTLGQQKNDTTALAAAEEAHRAALTVVTQENEPLSWAIAHVNLARVLALLAENTHDDSLLDDADLSCQLALKVFNEPKYIADGEDVQGIVEDLRRQLAGDRDFSRF